MLGAALIVPERTPALVADTVSMGLCWKDLGGGYWQLTAGLFALSHYPFYTFMGGTALVALCWGYVFATSRVLWFVIVAHWILGLMILM